MLSTRNLIRSSPLVYPLVKRLQRSDAGEFLCTRDSLLCLEGYPSSGNSFAYNVILAAGGEGRRIAHHCHAVANLKLALRHRVPAVVLVRDPADAVCSRLARFGRGVDAAVADYVVFNRFVWQMRDRLLVVLFNEVVGDPSAFALEVAAFSGMPLDPGDPATLQERVVETIERWSVENDRDELISLPREERERSKAELRQRVQASPRWPQASALWEQLHGYRIGGRSHSIPGPGRGHPAPR